MRAAGTAMRPAYHDLNANTVPDCEEAIDTDGDTVLNTDDDDGFTDVVENWVATHSLISCADDTAVNNEIDDKFGPDTTDNRDVKILDVLKFKPPFNASVGDAAWRRRNDLDMSSSINILDVLEIKPYFASGCMP